MLHPKTKFYVEKRRFTRLKSEFLVKCRVAEEKQAKEIETTTKNVSAIGVFFESKQLYPINTILELELHIPPLGRKVKILAKVLRTEELLKRSIYGIGAVFLKIDDQEKEKIIEFIKRLDINELLQDAIKRNASDLHLSVGHPPCMRLSGQLEEIDAAPLNEEDLRLMIYCMLTENQRKIFEEEYELDMPYYVPSLGRFRVNVHMQQGNVEATIRIIPIKVRTMEELGLPPVVADLARKENGLVLVTGPTGCGKSTTLAAMIDLINQEKKAVIISIEDPVEYIFEAKKSVIKQREVFYDTKSFKNALKRVFRQNPDVVFIGELRDRESIATALSAAEAGLFVLSTLHTIDTMHATNRIIDVFPPEQQSQIRVMLSECLQGIIAQKLLPRKDGKGLVLATEVLLATLAVRNLIKTADTGQIPSIIQTSKKLKMHNMNSSIVELCEKGLIDFQLAKQHLIPPFNKKFTYEARNKKGESVKGTIEAIGEDTAVTLLQGENLVVVSIEEVT